jgi:hypothetical protein
MCRFNLSAQELRAVVLEPWAQERWIEFGERKWSPHQATLTVLEGPRIPFGQLTMGRGWRAAERGGREVTEEVLAAVGRELARTADAADPAIAAGAAGVSDEVPRAGLSAAAESLAADALGLELLSRIGSERAALRRAWDLASERHPGSPPSATLALAERAVESLLRGALVVLSRGEEALGNAAEARPLNESEIAQALGAAASWAEEGAAGNVWMRRA